MESHENPTIGTETLNNKIMVIESLLLTQKLLLDSMPSIVLTAENAMKLHDINKYLNRVETALSVQIYQLEDIKEELLNNI